MLPWRILKFIGRQTDAERQSFLHHEHPAFEPRLEHKQHRRLHGGFVGEIAADANGVLAEREFARKNLGTDGREMNWVLIRAILASIADMAIIPLQDVLGLGSEARTDLPARPSGNWQWRFAAGQLTPEIGKRLREMVRIFDRGRSSKDQSLKPIPGLKLSQR